MTDPRDDDPGEPTGRGRPRDATRDAAVRRATLELLGEFGYDRLSVGSVAARAGVSKATIYRRWADKAAIVASAVDHLAASAPPQASGATLREDLLEVVGWLAEQMSEQDLGVVTAVLAGMRTDPELAAAMRDRLRRDRAALTGAALRGAARRGERVHPRADALLAEIAPALIMDRLLIVGEPCDRAFLAHVVDDVLIPLVSRQ